MEWNKQKALEAALAFQRGEQEGFEFFFNHLYYQLYHYTYKILKDNINSEDCVEVAFIKLWEHRSKLNYPWIIKSWLYTAVKNECLIILSKRKTEQVKQESIIQLAITEAEGIESAIIKTEVYRELYSHINELPPSCQRILRMIFLEKLSANDVSKKLSLHISAVKTQKARGLMLLRKKYNISKEQVEAKEYRWVKSVFFDSRTNTSRANLYGISRQAVRSIRKADLYKNITKDFLSI